MNRVLISALISLLLLSYTDQKSKEEWKTRSIYQPLTDRFNPTNGEPPCDLGRNTYCGGTYQGMIKQLDYIKDMGFNAIWISPVIKNTENSWHGYHAIDFYSLNPHFGTEQDLINLVNACHAKDIWVMVDVVANHIGDVHEDFSIVNPFNKQEHYHPKCDIQDYGNQWQVENCRLANLPDLNTENQWVVNELNKWISWLVKKFNFDGIRIDTVKHVRKSFWDDFAKAAGVFQIGEVFSGDINYIADYQNHLDSIFDYTLYYGIRKSFCKSDLSHFKEWMQNRQRFPNPKVLGLIAENHDNPRIMSNEYCKDEGGAKLDGKSLENALVLTIMWEGIPVIYYGGEQYFHGNNDPWNREAMWGHFDKNSFLYKMLAAANKVRSTRNLWNTNCVERFINKNLFVFTRGDQAMVVLSTINGSAEVYHKSFSTGTTICNVVEPFDCLKINGKTVKINYNRTPKIYVPQ